MKKSDEYKAASALVERINTRIKKIIERYFEDTTGLSEEGVKCVKETPDYIKKMVRVVLDKASERLDGIKFAADKTYDLAKLVEGRIDDCDDAKSDCKCCMSETPDANGVNIHVIKIKDGGDFSIIDIEKEINSMF